MADEWITQAEAARRARVQRSTIHDRVASGDMPANEQGQVKASDVAAYQARRESRTGGGLGDKKRAAEIQKLQADTAMKLLRLQRLQGALLPRDDVELWLSELITLTRSLLEAVPARVAERFPLKVRTQVQRECEAEITRALLALSQAKIPQAITANHEPPDTAATTKGETDAQS